MSSASTPAPRVPSPNSTRPHTLFWPMFILILGLGTLTIYQVMAMEDQLDEVTRAVDKMDSKVKLAEHERGLFFALARDVMAMAPADPNAEKVVVDFKLRELKAAKPSFFENSAITNTSPVDATAPAPAVSGTFMPK